MSKAEKELLDRELEQFKREPNLGSSWEEVKERLRKKSEESKLFTNAKNLPLKKQHSLP